MSVVSVILFILGFVLAVFGGYLLWQFWNTKELTISDSDTGKVTTNDGKSTIQIGNNANDTVELITWFGTPEKGTTVLYNDKIAYVKPEVFSIGIPVFTILYWVMFILALLLFIFGLFLMIKK